LDFFKKIVVFKQVLIKQTVKKDNKDVDWNGYAKYCGSSGTCETLAGVPRRLTARPAESDRPGTEIK
jgi:hypothetical protein